MVFVDEKSKKTDEQVTRVEKKVESCDFSLDLANDIVLSLEKRKSYTERKHGLPSISFDA